MKKTQKQVLGFLGLLSVAAMTFVASTMPSPGASAVGAVVDTLTVNVIDEDGKPHVNIVKPEKGILTYGDTLDFEIEYNSTQTSTLKLTFIGQNEDGTPKEPIVIDDYHVFDLGLGAGTTSITIDLNGDGTEDFGYGTFIFSLTNVGADGVAIPGEEISITRTPIIVGVNDEDNKDGSVNANIDFEIGEDPDTGGKVPTTVGRIDVVVYGPDENIVYGPKSVDPKDLIGENGGILPYKIPFDDFAKQTGDYKIKFSAFDLDGNYMYSVTKNRYYELLPSPDTGAFFQNLNIAREDYLITGLIIFFVFGVVGISIVARDRNTRSTKKRR